MDNAEPLENESDVVSHHETIYRHCDPLFLQDFFLTDGHSSETLNATATFIRYQGRHYALTCRHVVDVVLERRQKSGMPNLVPCLMADRIVMNLGCIEREGTIIGFRQPAKQYGVPEVDIAICPIDNYWGILKQKKNKVPINLDRWREPNWDAIKMLIAAGFPNEHKREVGDKVATSLVLAAAELSSAISANKDSFVLFSTLKEPHGIYFSGTSGGPVFWEDGDGAIHPIGIVKEGYPGGSEDWKHRESDAFGDLADINIHCHLLTPRTFESWLFQAGLQ